MVDSRPLGANGEHDRFSVIVLNRMLFSKIAMDSDYEGEYFHLDDRHWYSVTHSTRVQEVENYGEASECRLAEGTGTGFIWRLYSVARFEERDGGVYVELEAIALSRDVPASLRWLVSPVVRRVSRSSLVTSLEQTRAAVGSLVAAEHRGPAVNASARSSIANSRVGASPRNHAVTGLDVQCPSIRGLGIRATTGWGWGLRYWLTFPSRKNGRCASLFQLPARG